ncbi:hypothetical protein [Gordonia rhizosphera]|uniref:Uncharacterized protein n=1 Tax=Gordonia rhizosphera NBRC 16068 TaxID=1108045 RepID=K6WSY3_9ACTN|nr:hypothetical protein [Gordonia rhizosphera]GAB89669.1 hypothetical protein GORHZ_069_00480 [Gordonia rhizosphera NBRC 16068]
MIASDPLEAIEYTGGWLFDQSLAGWDVTVHVLEGGNTRPLGILGATVFDLGCSLENRKDGPWPQALAISTSLFTGDERVHKRTLAAIDSGRADIRFWGPEVTELDTRYATVPHRLSAAAQAFKRRACAAAHLGDDRVTPVESFRIASTARCESLVPAG